MKKEKIVQCKACGADIAKSATVCPHCGAKVKRRGCLTSVIGFLLILFAIGCFSQAFGGTSGGADSSQYADDAYYKESHGYIALSVEPSVVTGAYGNITIDGSVKNVSGKDLSYAQIEFALYDSDGAQVGTAAANISSLTEDSEWKFSALPLTEKQFATFELSSIAAY